MTEERQDVEQAHCTEWHPSNAGEEFGSHGGAAIGELIEIMNRLLLIAFLLVISPSSVFAYLMPVFDHEYITWTSYGPVGVGDLQESVDDPETHVVLRYRTVTHVYLGYRVQFRLPGSAAFWRWAGPALVLVIPLAIGLTLFLRRRAQAHA